MGGRVSRRDVFRTGAAAGAAAAVGSVAGAGAAAATPQGAGQPGGDGDLVLVNGRIHSMDDAGTVARAVSIRNGRFVSVGNSAANPGPGARVINLRGRTVVPGVVESHIHSVSLANRPGYHVAAIERATSISDIQELLAERRPDVPEGEWITALGGWHTNQWAERRMPTRAELDEAVSDRPVFLYMRFTGPAATNTLGKEYFDSVDDGPLPHPDAAKINTGDDGSIADGPFGAVTPATTALFLLRQAQTFDDKVRSTLDAMTYSASMGLTAHSDKVLFPTPGPLHPSQVLSNLDHYRMYDSWLHVHKERRSTIRLEINFLHNQNHPDLPELTQRLKNQFQFFGDDKLRTGAIGEWAAPLGAGPVWFEAQRRVAAAGWRNENAVGNLAELTQVVEGWEAVAEEFPDIVDLRWIVHHVPFVTTDLLDRLHALGAGVVMRAFTWVVGTPTANGAPFRTILDHGIKSGIEGDGVHIATLTPWPHMHYAITGVNALGQLINDGEQISRQDALRLFTRENAWFLRMEDEIGSIEVGKLADLVVLDRDYFSVPEEEIKRIRSVLTVVGGEIVHDTGEVT